MFISMDTLEILQKAIASKKPISFEYNKQGKIRGTRIGNPHIIYIFNSKQGVMSTKVDVVQTEGVSDSNDALPCWKILDVAELSNVQICEGHAPFTVNPDYHPESSRYENIIAKI